MGSLVRGLTVLVLGALALGATGCVVDADEVDEAEDVGEVEQGLDLADPIDEVPVTTGHEDEGERQEGPEPLPWQSNPDPTPAGDDPWSGPREGDADHLTTSLDGDTSAKSRDRHTRR